MNHLGVDPLTLSSLRAEITSVITLNEGQTVERLGEGMDRIAVLVAGELVFGFAKHEEAAAGLRREIALLPRLAPRLNLPVPRIEVVGEHSITGLPFVGYQLIHGEALHRVRFDQLSLPQREGIGRDLAEFLVAIHAFPIDESIECGVFRYDYREGLPDNLARARTELFPQLDPLVRRVIADRIERFVADGQPVDALTTLLPGDLWPEHVLISSDGGHLAGIINFADGALGDPDYDLAFLAQRLGPKFVQMMLPHLAGVDPVRLLHKFDCIALFNTLEDACAGLDRSDDELFHSAMAELTAQATSPSSISSSCAQVSDR